MSRFRCAGKLNGIIRYLASGTIDDDGKVDLILVKHD